MVPRAAELTIRHGMRRHAPGMVLAFRSRRLSDGHVPGSVMLRPGRVGFLDGHAAPTGCPRSDADPRATRKSHKCGPRRRLPPQQSHGRNGTMRHTAARLLARPR